jgi:NADPH2:quinone reductase
MTKTIRVHTPGPPSCMKWENVEVPNPKKGEVRIRNTAVGLNFIDTYHRKGMYPLPTRRSRCAPIPRCGCSPLRG